MTRYSWEKRFDVCVFLDVDVRMMDGRPFVLEVSNPRVPDLTEAQFLEIQEEINKSTDRVQVKDLQRVSK